MCPNEQVGGANTGAAAFQTTRRRSRMPTITKIIKGTTDANGSYSRTEVFDAPTPFPLQVQLKARLLSPADTTVSGSVDSDALDGNPQNAAKEFTITTGQQVSLGSWKLDGGDNLLVVSGSTSPIRANADVEIELEGKF